MKNNVNITNTLIKAGVELNIQDNYGYTPLDYGTSILPKKAIKFLKRRKKEDIILFNFSF
jgi:hypothetical protein